MGLIHSPSIVSDGLVLALDAQNSRSYGGSGTTWTDISYRGNNGTLTNGPTFEPGGPFAGSTGGSVYFDGTGDYLTWSGTTMTGDFTVEAWVYKTANPAGYTNVFNSPSLNNQFTIGRYDKNSIGLVINGSWVFHDGASTVTLNAWHHMAWVREGSTCRGYVNGVQINTGTSSGSVTLTAIGEYVGTAGYEMNGYISNARIINGTCLYPSGTTFTPPTKPLTPVSGTSLLTCQGGAIVDNSNNKFSITRNGNVRAIQSASIKLDGTNDFGEVARSNDFDFGTGDLTMESWVYITAYDAEATALAYKTQSSGSAGIACGNSLSASGLLYMLASDNTSYQVNVTGGTVTLGRWHHICMTRSGSTWTCYLNATQVSTATWAGSVSHVTTGTFGGIGMGAYTSAYGGDAGRYSMNGNISNVRIYKGKALTASEVQRNFNALRNRFGI